MERLDRITGLRTRFMEGLYEEADGVEKVPRGLGPVVEKMGLRFEDPKDKDQINSIIRYLYGHGLIEPSLGGRSASLTHAGVVEVEAALSNPEQATDYIGPVNNYIQIGTMTNSQLQQNSPGATQSLTVLGQEQTESVRSVVRDLRSNIEDLDLDEDDRAELEAEIQTLESQMTSPKPKKDITESGLRSAQRILEGTAAGAASSGLLQAIQTALSLL